ncbi:unnamed protein product [Phyllotreta striolata]|uniref:Synembryn n=1 Tax=Phyllotreta striolata TaxID=444603 RepID=A0A9N9TGH2_PHYSR|nr:unnamed protein product [Phyllotreta striolata]
MGTNIDAIILAEKENWGPALEDFINQYLETFTLPELNEGTRRKDVWNALYNIAKLSEDQKIIKNAFIAVRILSREKDHLAELINDDWIDLMMKLSGLNDDSFQFDTDNMNVRVEILRCLSNILFNSEQMAINSVNNGILDGLVKSINHFSNETILYEIKLLEIKLVFLITALRRDAREKVFHLMATLIQILEDILKEAADVINLNNEQSHIPPLFLTDNQAELACEVLKVLFNITINVNTSVDPEVLANCYTLVKTLRSYLIISSLIKEKTNNLRKDVIHLLVNMPDETYKELIPSSKDNRNKITLEFEGHNMTVVYEILMFLDTKLRDNLNIDRQHDSLCPVITVLLKGSSSNRLIRKFLRNQILPPLTDVHSRPEEGDTLRNHLCRLLTSPLIHLRNVVGKFLFVLCKKNASRMIKYTGYGNAAGFFAQEGLLVKGQVQDGDESSSDDSETEEYAEHKHGIDPVKGCYEELQRKSALENMTDEQKEYEAMKLAELMNNMLETGIIKPCTLGEDGKPKPIEHVLQLQEGLKNQMLNKNENDDSD